jgi:hypothetical protein
MTSQPDFVRPPAIAVRLISVLARAEDAESIQGDLLEEFSLLVSRLGAPSARRWYWRQTLKTIPRLVGAGFRAAPWMAGAAVIGGFLLRRLVAPWVEPAVFAVLDRYQVFDHHISVYRFIASTGIDIGHLITFLLIGFLVALVAKQSEIAATAVLALIWAALAVVGSIYGATRTGDYALLWRLTWYLGDSFAIVLAGAIVRMHRLAARSRPFVA